MKKALFAILLIVIALSCQPNWKLRNDLRALRKNMKVHINGFAHNEYVFTDRADRYLKINFLNDSIVEIVNTSKVGNFYHREFLNAKCRYIYKPISLTQIAILKSFIGCGFPQNPHIQYLKPYDPSHFTIDRNAIQYIFPNITNDTIRFSTDLERLQIREFSFDKLKTKR